MATNAWALLAIPGAFSFFILLWCFVMWVVSRASGWRRLAERFGTTSEFSGEIVSSASARIGMANYSGALHVGASEEGLYLVPLRIFRLFHPPLFVPWSEIEADPRKSAILPRVKMTIPNVPGKRIFLYGRGAKLCMPYVQQPSGGDSPS